ncbi:MAG: LytTR family transcriptional regulator DNA-binding domain-containing protein [Lachnospiraceae bacterium]|nr:LytTR family transcriptional regulator DNA-binding domain-containing protein [Lachnospiraceae bacterium]
MKVMMEQLTDGEEEIVIRYREMNERIEALCRFIRGQESKLLGRGVDGGGQLYLFSPDEVFYFESVDNAVYAYLSDAVYRIQESLSEITARCEGNGFLRCSRTMTIHIDKIEWLKSESGSRIRAFLSNGETVMISRKYAKELRAVLKRGRGRDYA